MEQRSSEKKSIVFLYHRAAELFECCCGHIVDGDHSCLKGEFIENVQVLECGFADDKNIVCNVCKEDEMEKEFYSQWSFADGYCRCTGCDEECDMELPKVCACTWYIDTRGVARCKKCDSECSECCKCDLLIIY